jgi:molybdate transport system substrate-binding protein
VSLAGAETVHVAVASNFVPAMRILAERFEAETGNRVSLSSGSTGKQYAQIHNGAPFDLFFAADAHHPELLELQGHTVADSRVTYAIGQLVLWSPQPGLVDADGKVLFGKGFRHLAIANPGLAPYGAAARQVLTSLGLWDEIQSRLVFGENVGQTLQLVVSGSAKLGFVARAQMLALENAQSGSWWQPPQSMYPPLHQQVVLLSEQPAARALWQYVRSEEARQLLRRAGYEVP